MKSLNFALLTLLKFSFIRLSIEKQLTIHINDQDHSDYCFILPKSRMTIGDSENGGNDLVESWCTKPEGNQNRLRKDIFTHGGPHITTESYEDGSPRWIQITGCFNPHKVKTLIPTDDGGQYDSNGGNEGKGNPTNSFCQDYTSCVELVEPNSKRICTRCCMDSSDCPIVHDEDGCEAVIQGQYC